MPSYFKTIVVLPLVAAFLASCVRNPSSSSSPSSPTATPNTNKMTVKAPAQFKSLLEKSGFQVEVVKPKSTLKAASLSVNNPASGPDMNNCQVVAYSDVTNGITSLSSGYFIAGPLKEPLLGEKLVVTAGAIPESMVKLDFISFDDFFSDPSTATWAQNHEHIIILYCGNSSSGFRFAVTRPDLQAADFDKFIQQLKFSKVVNFNPDMDTCKFSSSFFQYEANGRNLSGLTNGTDVKKYFNITQSFREDLVLSSVKLVDLSVSVKYLAGRDTAFIHSVIVYSDTPYTTTNIHQAKVGNLGAIARDFAVTCINLATGKPFYAYAVTSRNELDYLVDEYLYQKNADAATAPANPPLPVPNPSPAPSSTTGSLSDPLDSATNVVTYNSIFTTSVSQVCGIQSQYFIDVQNRAGSTNLNLNTLNQSLAYKSQGNYIHLLSNKFDHSTYGAVDQIFIKAVNSDGNNRSIVVRDAMTPFGGVRNDMYSAQEIADMPIEFKFICQTSSGEGDYFEAHGRTTKAVMDAFLNAYLKARTNYLNSILGTNNVAPQISGDSVSAPESPYTPVDPNTNPSVAFPCTVTTNSSVYGTIGVTNNITLNNYMMNKHPMQQVDVLTRSANGSFKNPHLNIVVPSSSNNDNGVIQINYGVIYGDSTQISQLSSNCSSGNNNPVNGLEGASYSNYKASLSIKVYAGSVPTNNNDQVVYLITCNDGRKFVGTTDQSTYYNFKQAVGDVNAHYNQNGYVVMVPFVPGTYTYQNYNYSTYQYEPVTMPVLKVDPNAPLAQLFPGAKVTSDPNLDWDPSVRTTLDNMGMSFASGVEQQQLASTEVPIFLRTWSWPL